MIRSCARHQLVLLGVFIDEFVSGLVPAYLPWSHYP